MVFCSNCGKKLSDDDQFCSSCGARTNKGVQTGATMPAEEELKEAFAKMAQEMSAAFATAAKEMQKAFKTAKESIEKSSGKSPVVCSHCGQENPSGSSFCYKCGKKLK